MGTRFLNPLLDRGDGGITWLLRDEFTTADPAPVSSPRTAEDTGTLTLELSSAGNAIMGRLGILVKRANQSAGFSFI